MINKRVSDRVSKCVGLIELACRKLPTVNRKTITDCSINLFQYYFHTAFCERAVESRSRPEPLASHHKITLEDYAVGCAMVVTKGLGYNIDFTWNSTRTTGVTVVKAMTARNRVYRKVADDGALKMIGVGDGIRAIEKSIAEEGKYKPCDSKAKRGTRNNASFTLYTEDEWRDAANVIVQCVERYGFGHLAQSRARKLFSVLTAWDSGKFEGKDLKWVALSSVILVARDLDRSIDLLKISKELVWGVHTSVVQTWIDTTVDSIKRLNLDNRQYFTKPGLLLMSKRGMNYNETSQSLGSGYTEAMESDQRQHFRVIKKYGTQHRPSTTGNTLRRTRQHFKF